MQHAASAVRRLHAHKAQGKGSGGSAVLSPPYGGRVSTTAAYLLAVLEARIFDLAKTQQEREELYRVFRSEIVSAVYRDSEGG